MVLRHNIQRRIGIIFFIFSFIVVLLNAIRSYHFDGLDGLLQWRNFSFFLYFILFGFSIKYQNEVFKFLQVSCIGIEGVLTLVDSPSDSFFGLLFLFIAILLAYAYHYFNRYKIIKSIGISVSLIYLFSKFSLHDQITPLLSSIMWVAFLWISLFILWIIFKDYVSEYKKQNELREMYLQQSLDKLKKRIEEYSEISHISLSTNKELLEIIKNHEYSGENDG